MAEHEPLRVLTFLGVLAHDLRSPLMGTGGFIEEALLSLEEGSTREEVEELLREALRGVSQLQALADGIRAFAHRHRGAVAQQVLDGAAITALFAEQGAQVVAHRGGPCPDVASLPSARVNVPLFRLAVREVLDNAQRHRARESVVRVWSEVEAGNDGRTRYVVFNEGGRPDPVAALRLLWRTPDSDGLGVGLALAQQAMLWQGGWVQVEAHPGGCQCSLWLPPIAEIGSRE